FADLPALQVLLRAAEIARDDRKRPEVRVTRKVALAYIDERPDDDVASVVGDELRRHRLELSAEEQIQEERRENVVAVMSERDLGRADLRGDAIQRATAQPRAERAHRPAFGDHALHDAVGVLLDDPPGYAALREIARQHVGGEPRLLLIEVH